MDWIYLSNIIICNMSNIELTTLIYLKYANLKSVWKANSMKVYNQEAWMEKSPSEDTLEHKKIIYIIL